MRLPVETVQRLHRVLEGDPVFEGSVLRFIQQQYGARNLLWLPEKVAEQILRRPEDFRRAVRRNEEAEPPTCKTPE